MAQISVESFKRVDVVIVKGRVDGGNAPEMEQAFKELNDDGRYRLVADFSEINFMASAGLRVLTAVLQECKRHNGDLRIAAPSKRMTEVLELSGLDKIFSTYEDTISAVGSY